MSELLFLAHRIPYPPNKGDKIRSFHILKHLARHHRVHLGTFVDDPADLPHRDTVSAWCAETYYARLHPRVAKLKSLRGLVNGEALTFPYYRHRGLKQWVDDLARRRHLDCALAYSACMAPYLPRTAARRAIDFVDIDSDKWRQYSTHHRGPLAWLYRREARRLGAAECAWARAVDVSLLVSPAEAAVLQARAPDTAARIAALDNGVDVDYFAPGAYPNPYPADTRALVFTGAMDYFANVDAVCWFAREVFTALRAHWPRLAFYIVGARPAPVVRELQRIDGVQVNGQVADVRPYLAHAVSAVASLRIARGIQNKVLEALAMDRPILVTPAALEGIAPEVGRFAQLGADAPQLIQRARELLDGATPPAGAARDAVLKRYRWALCLAPLEGLLCGTETPP